MLGKLGARTGHEARVLGRVLGDRENRCFLCLLCGGDGGEGVVLLRWQVRATGRGDMAFPKLSAKDGVGNNRLVKSCQVQ